MGRLVENWAMPSIVGAKALQVVGTKLPFCYVCGETFVDGVERNRDHVPSTSCISQADKPHTPLILPTHVECNSSFAVDDERVGQFMAILHGKAVEKECSRLAYQDFVNPSLARKGITTQAITNVDMYSVVERWVRAFHAALYMQPLPLNARFATELPFEVISPVEEGHIVDNGRPRQRSLCEETLKRNRLTKTLDRLAAWNGNMLYECVWERTPLHAYCVFWIDFYDWGRLARLTGKEPRDCVGFYMVLLGELPPSATIATRLVTDDSGNRFGL